MTEIFTDGAVGPKGGTKSGWAYVVMSGGGLQAWQSGSIPRCSSNKAELRALLEALSWGMHNPDIGVITIWTDSGYLARGFAHLADKLPQDHQSDWQLLKDFLVEFRMADRVVLRWLKGHTGVFGNEEADRLAYEAATT